MTREEIISMLSTELNEKWDNGITCLIVENSDGCIPVIVHHQKDRLIVEVGEKDKKIYPIEWNELNHPTPYENKSRLIPESMNKNPYGDSSNADLKTQRISRIHI